MKTQRQNKLFYVDRDNHAYYFNGKKLPSVTELLSPLFNWDGIPQSVLDYARERGSAVHKACELYDLAILDEDSVDAVVRPYLNAWIAFKEQTGFVPIHIEKSFYHPYKFYAGTPDRTGVMQILNGSPKAVVDIKAVTQMSPVTGIQLAGYKDLLSANGVNINARYGVQLLPDGKYKLYPFTDLLDEAAFTAQLITYQWKMNHGKPANSG